MYTVKRTEDQLWTVGKVCSNGEFEPVSDHVEKQEAEDEATRLNGGTPNRDNQKLYDAIYALAYRIADLEEKVEHLTGIAQGYQAAFYDEAYRNMKLAEENLELSTL